MSTRRRTGGDSCDMVANNPGDIQEGLACRNKMHVNFFNLDHNLDQDMPMFCKCGRFEFKSDELDIDFNNKKRWLSIVHEE